MSVPTGVTASRVSTTWPIGLPFGVSQIVKTKFPLDFNPMGRFKQEDVDRLKALPLQTSFAWESFTKGKKIVVCGVGAAEFAGWTPIFGQEMDDSDLKQNSVQ